MIPDYPGARVPRGPGREDLEKFASDAEVADACLKGAIERIRVFGVARDEPEPAKPARGRSRGSLTQHFHGPVNQAVAMDSATQNVGHIGPSGSTVDEVVRLLRESEELTKREVGEAARAAEQLNAEVQKPDEGRNWKSVAEWGNTLLGIAGKATDLTEKLTSHMPWIAQLVEQARHHSG